MTIGLKGHVLNPAFPESYNNWQATNPRDLIDAELIKEPTDKNVVRALKKVAEDADDIVIATDYDREGELIGLEALQEVVAANPELATAEGCTATSARVKRARYSALTKDEIERAFDEPRRALDAARQRRRGAPGHGPDLGRDPDPLGLDGDPALRLQLPLRRPGPEPDARADRAARARAARPRARALLGGQRDLRATPTATSSPSTPLTSSGRRRRPRPRSPTRRPRARSRRSRRGRTPASRRPPSTPLLSRPTCPAGSASPPRGRCGSPRTSTWTATSPIPRTDNTVYPKSLDTKELVQQLVAVDDFKAADFLLDGRSLEATRGKKETTDHPPIYPTQAVNPDAPRGALRGPPPGLRAGRPPLPRHLLAADDQRVDPGQHRDREGHALGRVG